MLFSPGQARSWRAALGSRSSPPHSALKARKINPKYIFHCMPHHVEREIFLAPLGNYIFGDGDYEPIIGIMIATFYISFYCWKSWRAYSAKWEWGTFDLGRRVKNTLALG